MRHVVVGTAGHIDHGKTELVKALTGMDTDRLKEEKERGITIDLGFAYLDLTPSLRISIVDVPGHERFVRNMVAGATGIDLVLMVIAADEGVMPQTREHLEICELLGVKGGLVAITKADLVEHEWLKVIKDDVKSFLKGTFLESAPLVVTSTITGEGVKELQERLVSVCEVVPEREFSGPFRLPIDRAFIIKGFGLVVTGTVSGGCASVGELLQLLPHGVVTRVRGLEVHGEGVKRVITGERAAMNITGVEKELVKRGDVLAAPGHFRPTHLLDLSFRLLPEVKPLKNWSRVRFHCGTKEAIGRVKLLGCNTLSAGSSTYVRLHLEEPVIAAPGDRFVVRSFSPVLTIGGGEVIDSDPSERPIKKRVLFERLGELDGALQEKRLELFLLWSGRDGLTSEEARFKVFPYGLFDDALSSLRERGVALAFSDHYFHREAVEELARRVLDALGAYFQANPLKSYLSKEELAHRVGAREKVFVPFLNYLSEKGMIRLSSEGVSLPGKGPSLSPEEGEWLRLMEEHYRSSCFTPPSLQEVSQVHRIPFEKAKSLASLLTDRGSLVKISKELYLHKESLEELLNKVENFFRGKDALTVGEFKDLTSTSRKYAVPLLEYLDFIGMTRRVGNVRRAKKVLARR